MQVTRQAELPADHDPSSQFQTEKPLDRGVGIIESFKEAYGGLDDESKLKIAAITAGALALFTDVVHSIITHKR